MLLPTFTPPKKLLNLLRHHYYSVWNWSITLKWLHPRNLSAQNTGTRLFLSRLSQSTLVVGASFNRISQLNQYLIASLFLGRFCFPESVLLIRGCDKFVWSILTLQKAKLKRFTPFDETLIQRTRCTQRRFSVNYHSVPRSKNCLRFSTASYSWGKA